MPSLSKKTVLSFLLSVVLLTQVAAVSQFKSFRIPTKNSEPEGITLGPDGNMWFAEAAANQIGRIDPTGKITDSLFRSHFQRLWISSQEQTAPYGSPKNPAFPKG